jgi:hypothetical protein
VKVQEFVDFASHNLRDGVFRAGGYEWNATELGLAQAYLETDAKCKFFEAADVKHRLADRFSLWRAFFLADEVVLLVQWLVSRAVVDAKRRPFGEQK